MTAAPTAPVVIVGAGPTGLTAAALLASYGVASLVIERWHDVYPQPRAVHLDDEVFRILARLGLAGRFGAMSRPARGLRLVDRDLAVLAEFDRDRTVGVHGYPQANMFDQPELESLLRALVSSQSLVALRGGCEVTGVEDVGGGVRVSYVDLASGAPAQVVGPYVLGCDGANSVVRAAIGARMQDLGFEQRWLVVDVETELELRCWEGVYQICDVTRAGSFMRIGATRYRWEFRLHDDEDVADFRGWDGLAPLLAPWLPSSAGPEVTVVRVADYTFRAQVADRWRCERVFLLGDAAHLTPPFIGQGMGAGLRDALNLTWKLAGVSDGSLWSGWLATYETERSPHVRELIRTAMVMGVVMTAGGLPGSVVRRLLLPLLPFVPGLRGRVVDSASPRLRVVGRGGRGNALVGTLCPNAPLEDGRRYDEVAGGRFVVLTRVTPAAAQRAEVARRGARLIGVDAAGALAHWLRAGDAMAVVVRPDATVASAHGSVGAALCALAQVGPRRD